MLPADYTAEHVTLAYALTVHKAQGVTVDRAVLMADAATTAEHLYVGMNRDRFENRVCVITDAATTGHGRQRPLEPTEILAAVMRRSSAEISAMEKLRRELAESEDPAVLRRLWEHARNFIDAGAGPDRRSELRRLQKLRAELPILEGIAAVKRRELDRTDRAIAATRHGLAAAEARLQDLTRRRLLRRPDHEALDTTTRQIQAQKRRLTQLLDQSAAQSANLVRSARRLDDAHRHVARIPDLEAAVSRRNQWLSDHTPEIEWEADLRGRLKETVDEPDVAQPEPDPTERQPRYELGDFDVDLRTLDLSGHRARAGLQRQLGDALGPARLRRTVDVPRPPLPDRGIDGPDFGL